ncbi:MAG: hypothetical protein ACNS60_09290 [Candidatus Cyclobacteriaceae bacterium M2_1C_046]
MEREQIKELLEKYWEGETNLEEEKALKQYFARPDVPEDLRQEGAFFQYLGLQEDWVGLEDEEILEILRNEPQQKNNKQFRLYIENFAKVAAAILIVAVAVFFIREDYESRKEQMDPVLSDTFEDPQKAFEETKKALMLVSRQFNKGHKHAAKIGAFDDATDKVQDLDREL